MKPALVPVLLLSLVNTLGFSLLIPVLPVMLRHWQFADWTFGLMLSVYSLCQFWASPIFGRLSDQWGRRPLLIWSHAGTLGAWLVFAGLWAVEHHLQAPALILVVLLTFSRVVDGITGGNNAVTQAYMSDVSNKQEKAVYFGYMSAAMGVAMIIGPAIGAYTLATSLSYLATALFGIGLSTVTLLFLIFALPEPQRQKAPKQPIDWLFPFRFVGNFRALQGQPVIQNVFVVKLFLTAAMGAYTSIMVFYLIDHFGFKETQIGNFLFFVGGFAIFNQLVMIKPIIARLGEARALAMGLVLLSAGLLVFPVISELWVLVCVYYLVNLGFSVAFPTIKAVVSNEAEEHQQGQLLGLLESIQSLMFGVMPIVSTLVYGQLSVNSFAIWAGLSFVGLVYLGVRCPAIFRPTAHDTSKAG